VVAGMLLWWSFAAVPITVAKDVFGTEEDEQ
jgi:hypothetical protein